MSALDAGKRSRKGKMPIVFSYYSIDIYIHIKKKKENITDKTRKCDRLANCNYLKKKKKKKKKRKRIKETV